MRFESPEQKAERELEELLKASNPTDTPEPAGQEGEGEGEPPAEEEPEPKVEEPSEPEPQDDPNSDTYKARWQSLQGVYRSERERWQEEKADLQNRITELESRPAPQVEVADLNEDYVSTVVTEQIRSTPTYQRLKNEYGQKHAELHFESLAASAPAPEPAPQQTGQEKFFIGLSTLAPKWEQLNNDANFLQWLNQTIPYSNGETLHSRLNAAVNNNDAVSAAQFFIDYQDQLRPTPAPQQPDEHIAPPKRGSAAQSAADDNKGQVYTVAQWNEGWKEAERLALTNPERSQELENELTVASTQGRVVGL